MREYGPAGFLARSAWGRFRLRTEAGYRGWARRLWLANNPTDPDGILLSDCIVEELHCEKDTERTTAYTLRSSEATHALAQYGMEVLDRPSHSETTVLWQHSDLTFRSLRFDEGPYTCEVMEVSRSQSPVWQAEEIGNSIRSSIRADSPRKSKFCIYSLWRAVWSFADCWLMIVAIFAVNALLAAVLPAIVVFLSLS
jgi:hypothetical protein